MKRRNLPNLLACVAVITLGAGCKNGPHLSREDQIRLLMTRNRDLAEKLLAAEKRVADLQRSGATPAPAKPPTDDPFRSIAVRFSKHTGGLNTDGAAGDERIKIIVQPLDAEGDVVKRAGRLVLEAFEPQGDGKPHKPYHRWELGPERLAETWIGSLGIRGYVMKWPWPGGRMPAGETLILRATFTTLSGEALVAEAEVTIVKPPARDAETP